MCRADHRAAFINAFASLVQQMYFENLGAEASAESWRIER